MKVIKTLSLLVFLLFSYNSYAKNIVIVTTGGTISGAGESSNEVKYVPGKITVESLLKSVPNLEKFANIKAEQLMQISSQDITSQDWIKIANKLNDLLSRSDVDGVVLTHGTDTLEETAYFLNLVLKSKKPVIIVGSMRPSTSISADGSMNIYNAVALASSKDAYNKGVLVLLNDEIYAARDVSKLHTTNVNSFKSPNSGPIGQVYYGDVKIYYENLRLHTASSNFSVKNIVDLPKVDIIYAHAGFDSGIVDYLVKSGSKAIVVAGVGDGNINKETMNKLIDARKKGVFIVRSSRVGAGAVVRNTEVEDDKFDFITSDNLSPQKARILTILALTKTENSKKISEMFGKY
ncbi:MAG: asparaginase [Pelagibacterales bacterium]|nr:asparaginase [Pelagibacterales bacterium]